MLKAQGFRLQRTIRRSVEVTGVGFLTGADVRVVFRPAKANIGIRFVRRDVACCPAIAAHVAHVTGTNRRTTLGRPPHQVELVEHVLAALAGLRIDNCLVELNAPELPGLDGSSRSFAEALREAGAEIQNGTREIWTVDQPISVSEGNATLTMYPHDKRELRISYLLDYGPRSPLGPQRHTHLITPEEFRNGLEACRTFLLEEEAQALRRQGIGLKTTLQDLVVFGPQGPLHNRLRAADEPARHKVLDIVGDLALIGHDLHGHVVACRSGHTQNVALARRLAREIDASRPQTLPRAA